MSSIARWSYTYKATVAPFVGLDGVTGQTLYGTPYEIMCNVASVTVEERAIGGTSGANGIENNAQHVIYTEDARPKKGDTIEFAGSDGPRVIIDHTFWEMTAFNDVPDYKLVT